LKHLVAKYEMAWYLVTGVLYFVAIVATWLMFPDVGNLELQITILFTGLTSTAAAAASALKSSEDAED
jgi:antibiotic biosynthesis monooxygenase (ABM) superfamily enzyme